MNYTKEEIFITHWIKFVCYKFEDGTVYYGFFDLTKFLSLQYFSRLA